MAEIASTLDPNTLAFKFKLACLICDRAIAQFNIPAQSSQFRR
ncbi:MAG: hypothetical protein AAGA60_07730 [Cyanobacteria bacterium P01_E01_bin.42]